MQADGISLPPSASAAPIGRPRRRKAPRGWAPRSLRKSLLPFRSPKKHRPRAKRIKRQRLSLRKSSQKQRRLGLSPNRKRLWDAVLRPLGQVRGIGADGAATTRIVLPVALTTPLGSANRGRSGHREGIHPRRPKRKLRLPLNGRRARPSKTHPRFQLPVSAGALAIPGWPRGLRSSK
jgi:hypothetical protein